MELDDEPEELELVEPAGTGISAGVGLGLTEDPLGEVLLEVGFPVGSDEPRGSG